MGRHTVKRGEARFRTGRCIDCGADVAARRSPYCSTWYIVQRCAGCVRYQVRLSMLSAPSYSARSWREGVMRRIPRLAKCPSCHQFFRPMSKGKRGWTRTCSIACRHVAQTVHTSNRDRININRHIRRARAKKAGWERTGRAKVIARDGLRCHVCRRLVNLASKTWEKQASLDHVIPISQGGSHTMRNLRLAHLGCNVGRGKVSHAQEMLL